MNSRGRGKGKPREVVDIRLHSPCAMSRKGIERDKMSAVAKRHRKGPSAAKNRSDVGSEWRAEIRFLNLLGRIALGDNGAVVERPCTTSKDWRTENWPPSHLGLIALGNTKGAVAVRRRIVE